VQHEQQAPLPTELNALFAEAMRCRLATKEMVVTMGHHLAEGCFAGLRTGLAPTNGAS
jgi:hypothetical protein